MAAPRTLFVLLALAACGPASPGASTTDGAGTTEATSSASPTSGTNTANPTSTTAETGDPATCLMPHPQGTEGGPESGSEETSGGPVVCPPIAGQPCTAPIDCTGQLCGSHVSMLDANGCPRASCSDDADCGPGEGCATQDQLQPVTCVDDQET